MTWYDWAQAAIQNLRAKLATDEQVERVFGQRITDLETRQLQLSHFTAQRIKQMADELDTLKADYEANKAIVANIGKEVASQAAQIAELKAALAVQPSSDPRVAALVTEMESDNAALAAKYPEAVPAPAPTPAA